MGRAHSEMRHRSRMIAFANGDLMNLTAILLEKYPDLRFSPYEFWNDLETGKRLRPPHLRMQYVEGLHCGGWSVRFWRQPVDWEPLWLGPNENGVHGIANLPRLSASVQIGGLPELGDQSVWSWGRMIGSFEPGDREHERFIASAFRLLDKVATRTLKMIDVDTGAVLHASVRTTLWVGHDVMSWLRRSPKRTIAMRYKAPD